VDQPEILARLNKLEDAILSGLQELRLIKAEIQMHANGSLTLEPLLEAEDFAKILSGPYRGDPSGREGEEVA